MGGDCGCADQVGTEVKCPKCNATFTVGRPAAPTVAASPTSDSDAYEPEIPLARSSIVPDDEPARVEPSAELRFEAAPTFAEERPEGEAADLDAVAPIERQHEVDWSVSDDLEPEAPLLRPPSDAPDHLDAAKALGLVRSRRRLEPPRSLFFSDVFGFPWQGLNLSRWAAMSFGLSISSVVSYKVIDALGLLDGQLTITATAGLFFGALAIMMLLATLSFCSAAVLSAIQDTADGHLEVQESSMPEWDQWIFTFLGMLSLSAAAGAVGYPLSLIEPIGALACLGSFLLLFPFLLLSALEVNSFLFPFSLPVLRTLGRRGKRGSSSTWSAARCWQRFWGSRTCRFARAVRDARGLRTGDGGADVDRRAAVGAAGVADFGAPMALVEATEGSGKGTKPKRAARQRLRLEFPGDLDDAASLIDVDRARRGALLRVAVLRHDGEHPRRAATASFDLHRCDAQIESARGQLVQPGQILQPITAGLAERVMDRKVARQPVIGAHRVEPDAADVPVFDEPLDRLDRKARKVQPAHYVLPAIAFGLVPELAPAGVGQHDGAGGNLAVRGLERLEVGDREAIVGVGPRGGRNIDHDGALQRVFPGRSASTLGWSARNGWARPDACQGARARQMPSTARPSRSSVAIVCNSNGL